MSLNIKSVVITSDDDLRELVTDALADILGDAYELVNDDMPLEGNHILALSANKQPHIIVFDKHDGVHAMLSGLSVLETLSKNSVTMQRMNALIQRLHPDAFNGNKQSQFRIENTHLIVLSPNPPPCGTYLSQALSHLSFYTFQAWQVEDKTGLLIEPCSTIVDTNGQQRDAISEKAANPFRGGQTVMSPDETTFFQNI